MFSKRGGITAIMMAALLGLGAAAPAAAVDQGPIPVGTTKQELFGTVIRDSKWNTMPIPVCWEDSKAADAPYRAISRRAAEDTWAKWSGVKFVGWGSCTATSNGIRIAVADVGPHVKTVGRYLDARPQGMVLNFTFTNWSTGCAQQRDFCVYAIAAHEFGHAIGFTHEQNREDAPAECRELAQGSKGDYNVTKYDPASIMNYCNERWNGDGQLSELDIEAVQWFYGKP